MEIPQLNPQLNWTTELIERSHVPSFYNFGKDRIEISNSNSSSIVVCLFIAAETIVDSAGTILFPQVHFRIQGHVC
jgi:hypothetical protein